MKTKEEIQKLRDALEAMLQAYAWKADWTKPNELHSAVVKAGKALGKLQ